MELGSWGGPTIKFTGPEAQVVVECVADQMEHGVKSPFAHFSDEGTKNSSALRPPGTGAPREWPRAAPLKPPPGRFEHPLRPVGEEDRRRVARPMAQACLSLL